MRRFIRSTLFARRVWPRIAVVALCLSGSEASAQIGYRDGFSESILMGHSFFRPASDEILELVGPTGHSRHSQIRKIAGGTNGDAGALWRDVPAGTGIKAEIEAGGVELFGVAWSPDADDNELADFAQWIDLAIQHNSNTLDTVFIHSTWVPNSVFGTHAGARIVQNNWNQTVDGLVSQLRSAYPDLTILHMPTGEIMLRLWNLAEQGLLGPEIQGVLGDGDPEHYLQFDSTGHAGWIMVDAMGLMWHKVLYPEYDIRTVQDPTTFQFKKDWTYDISQLVHDIYEDFPLAQRYNDPPVVPTAPYFYTSPVVEAMAAEGVEYSGPTLADNAGDINYDSLTFERVSGPTLLNIATNGALSGIPGSGDVGLNRFTVSVSDGIFPAVEETLEIMVISAVTRYYPVVDGSFENVITNESSTWDYMNAVWNDDADHEYEVKNKDAQEGSHKAYLYRIKTIYQDVGLVNTGETVQVSYWTQGGPAAGELLCEFLVDEVSQGIQTNALNTDGNGEGWSERTHTVQVTESGMLRLKFYITGDTRCYMDHVSEVAVTPAAAQPDAPQSTFQINGAGQVGFSIGTSVGTEYRLVYKNELTSTNGWLPVTPPFPSGWTNGTGASILISDPDSAVSTQRFYRVEARTPSGD